jgi:hypothetical protein
MDGSALIGAIISIVGGLIGFYVGWTSTRPKKEEGKDAQKTEKAER